MYSCLKSAYNDVIIKQTKTEKVKISRVVPFRAGSGCNNKDKGGGPNQPPSDGYLK